MRRSGRGLLRCCGGTSSSGFFPAPSHSIKYQSQRTLINTTAVEEFHPVCKLEMTCLLVSFMSFPSFLKFFFAFSPHHSYSFFLFLPRVFFCNRRTCFLVHISNATQIPDFVDPLDETARSALAKSCYLKIDWKISEDAPVSEAINRMVANTIGALAVSNAKGEVVGIVSERDYLNKVSFMNKEAKNTKVSEVCTYGAVNLISVTLDNPIDKCMRKMLDRNVRHLLIREKETGQLSPSLS